MGKPVFIIEGSWKGLTVLDIYHASTFEMDDPGEAVEELLEQLDIGMLLRNSVGIIACHLDYINNGTVKMLCDKLPFDVIGGDTNISDICGAAGEDQLALMVLTSDDVYFSCGITEPLDSDPDEEVAELYHVLADKLSPEPKMGLFFGPMMLNLSGDAQVRTLDKATNNLPIFGTIVEDYGDSIREPYTIYNGDHYSESIALLLIGGAFEPKYYFSAMPEESFVKQKAVITKSDVNVLMEVNNMRAIDYIASLGLAENGQVESIPSIPLSVDIGDGGQAVARAMLGITPEGYVICAGEMPENAALGVGSIAPEDVLHTSEELAEHIVSSEEHRGALIFSCLSRNMALGLETMSEIERVQGVLEDRIPYLFLYSGGEIYPEIVGDKVYNKAHNDSIIACIF